MYEGWVPEREYACKEGRKLAAEAARERKESVQVLLVEGVVQLQMMASPAFFVTGFEQQN